MSLFTRRKSSSRRSGRRRSEPSPLLAVGYPHIHRPGSEWVVEVPDGIDVSVRIIWRWYSVKMTVEEIARFLHTVPLGRIFAALAWCYDNPEITRVWTWEDRAARRSIGKALEKSRPGLKKVRRR